MKSLTLTESPASSKHSLFIHSSWFSKDSMAPPSKKYPVLVLTTAILLPENIIAYAPILSV